jgi:hypothetical protein
MSNKVAKLLEDIQYKTQKSLEDIANDIGYSRPYLNNVKLAKEDNEKVYNKLRVYYSEILQNVSKQPANGLSGQGDETQSLTARALELLAESNRILAIAADKQSDANKEQSLANKILAETNRDLVTRSTGLPPETEATINEMTILLMGLRDYTAQLGASVKKSDAVSELQNIHKMVSSAKKDLEKKGKTVGVGR